MSRENTQPFHSAFYVANFMEIFERFAWYGMYTLLALYLTSPLTQGGLGLAQTQKGLIMGVVPFFLYLFPIVSGALADRYGYRKMFLLSFIIMTPSYFLLGQIKDMWSFTAVFMLVALGAGIFKPVVTGTIGRTTNASNRGLGFGIFYMMVNIGGALGPLIAPIIQKHYGWQWVFNFAAIWIAVNFIPALFFYKDPIVKRNSKSLKQVFQEMQLVLGNGRLGLLVFPLLILLVAYNANLVGGIANLSSGWVTVYIAFILFLSALIWDILVGRFNRNNSQNQESESPWYLQRMKLGNKPFMIYLLIMSGFWTVYLQLFITLPSFIRDFVDTSDLVVGLQDLGPWFYNTFTAIDVTSLKNELAVLASNYSTEPTGEFLNYAKSSLASLDIRVANQEIQTALKLIAEKAELNEYYASLWSKQNRQVNPGTILGLDFLMIVFFQLIISALIKNWKVLPTLIAGTAILTLGMWIGGLANGLVVGGGLIATSVMIFATGEMIASPKSQEYVASFAPKDQVAMFMGYYFVAIALGNLFGGLLSGWLYQTYAISQSNPMMMWSIISLLGVVTCFALFVFSKTLVQEIEQQQKLAAE